MFEFPLYIIGCFLFLIVTEKYRIATFGIAVIIAILFPIMAEVSEFGLFLQIK